MTFCKIFNVSADYLVGLDNHQWDILTILRGSDPVVIKGQAVTPEGWKALITIVEAMAPFITAEVKVEQQALEGEPRKISKDKIAGPGVYQDRLEIVGGARRLAERILQHFGIEGQESAVSWLANEILSHRQANGIEVRKEGP